MDNRTHETPAELAGLLEEIAVSLAEMAEARRVQLQLQFAPTPVWLQHETSQLRNNLRVFAENMILIAEAGSVIRIYMWML